MAPSVPPANTQSTGHVGLADISPSSISIAPGITENAAPLLHVSAARVSCTWQVHRQVQMAQQQQQFLPVPTSQRRLQQPLMHAYNS